MLMTTDPGDLVLDPTCGSGTTAFVAEQWGRRWITVDTSRVALALARQRLMGARFPYYLLADSAEGRAKESSYGAAAAADGTANDIRHGFVYERVPHITLKSIANNPDIKEGMTREEIDEAIRRHAEYELLYDKPYEDKQEGPGRRTVHRREPVAPPLPRLRRQRVDGTGADRTTDDRGRADATVAVETSSRRSSPTSATAGIQNGAKGERLEFDTVEPYAATYIQAVGEREDAPDGLPKRVGITIGPQYGTVGPGFIKDAAREANRAGTSTCSACWPLRSIRRSSVRR